MSDSEYEIDRLIDGQMDGRVGGLEDAWMGGW